MAYAGDLLILTGVTINDTYFNLLILFPKIQKWYQNKLIHFKFNPKSNV